MRARVPGDDRCSETSWLDAPIYVTLDPTPSTKHRQQVPVGLVSSTA